MPLSLTFAIEPDEQRAAPRVVLGPDGEIHDPTDLCRPADYPQKIISHKEGRERALEAYRAMKED